MGRLHKSLKKIHPLYHIDEGAFDALHPMGTAAEGAYDSRKATEKELKDLEAGGSTAIPLPDEEEIARQERKRAAKRARASRAATIYSTEEGFGG